MKIGFVCTNYNNSSFTLEAIRTLFIKCDHEYKIVVVDNNSDAKNVEDLHKISASFKDVKFIYNKDNVGYFSGLNIGIKYLRTNHHDIEWMVVGNNDLEFPSNFGDSLSDNLEKLVAHAVISPDVITVDGHHQNPHVINRISRLRNFIYDIYYSNYFISVLLHKMALGVKPWSRRADEDQWQKAQPIHQGHGSCYLLGPRFFAQFEELWAPTFLMAEEFFLSKQLSDVGQQVYYEPAIQVIHHWHASLAKLPGKKRWIFARDAHKIMRKYQN